MALELCSPFGCPQVSGACTRNVLGVLCLHSLLTQKLLPDIPKTFFSYVSGGTPPEFNIEPEKWVATVIEDIQQLK